MPIIFCFTVSDLHGQVFPPKSVEPPIVPQTVETPDTVTQFTEAKLQQKLFAKLKGIIIHLLYLGKAVQTLSLW